MRRLVVVAAVLAALATPGAAAACRAIAVSGSIQAAVDQAQPCDWVLVPPGVYRESVTIGTANIHLRGLNRGAVVLDGQHRAATGIEIRAAGVSVENLTVRDFDAADAIRWDGTAGWKGSYLTAYDTGLGGLRGVTAAAATDGTLDHVYTGGFAEAGVSLRSCRDCRTTISHVLAERNGVGISLVQTGGHLVVRDSLTRWNVTGILLASDPADAGQFGTCDLTGGIPLTHVERCTVLRRNRVEQNTAIGIELAGASANRVENNIVTGNRNFGIVGHELVDPVNGVGFTLTGNRFEANLLRGSRYDLALAGGSGSVNNCLAGNRIRTLLPADPLPWSCERTTTPAPDPVATQAVLALLAKIQAAKRIRTPVRAPPAQPTMPDPCRGVPPSPLCTNPDY